MAISYPQFPRFKSIADKGSDVLGNKGKDTYQFEFRTIKVFHMKNFYRFVYWYLLEEGWRAAEDESENDEKWETFFEEWRMPDNTLQRRIWWRLVYCPESPHGRTSSRYRYYLDLNFVNLFLKNTETVVGGRKVTAQEGEVKVVVKGYIKIFDDDVQKHPFVGKVLYHFFRKRWYKQIYEGYREDIRFKLRGFQDALKDFFNMAAYQDDHKNFHLERGL